MNPTRRILLIDDESQKNSLEKIENGLKDRLVIESKQIEVLHADYLDDEANLKPERVYEAIETALKSARYDLILVDYSFGQVGIDGLDVIKQIRIKHPKEDLILYSANQREIIAKVVGENLKDSFTKEIISGINELMNFRIAKIVSRPAMDSEIIGFLRSDTTFSPYGFIINVLRENRDKVFLSCYPKLSGNNEWLSAILEQLIVYLSEVNE